MASILGAILKGYDHLIWSLDEEKHMHFFPDERRAKALVLLKSSLFDGVLNFF